MDYTHPQIIQAIKDVSAKINLNYSKDGDGRITSAVKEMEYLNLLEKGLKENHPSLKFEHQPKVRHWWDFMVNGIPIDLKLTTGCTDDACSKVAIIYTICGSEPKNKNMNFNKFWETIKACQEKPARDPMTEFHYLAVNKDNGEFLLKSILDIHTYKTNPSNDLQISWKNEFAETAYRTTDYKAKIRELLKAVQTSVKQSIQGKKEFADADIDADFA
jgi:hypothetical protein